MLRCASLTPAQSTQLISVWTYGQRQAWGRERHGHPEARGARAWPAVLPRLHCHIEGGPRAQPPEKRIQKARRRARRTSFKSRTCLQGERPLWRGRQVWTAMYHVAGGTLVEGHKVETKTFISPIRLLTHSPEATLPCQCKGEGDDRGGKPCYNLSNCMYYRLREAREGAILMRQPVPLCLIHPHIPQIEKQTVN